MAKAVTPSRETAAPTRREAPGAEAYAPEPPSHHLPPMGYADMPEPLPLRKILGPSVILAGLGVGSGEYILWPYITTNVGLGFLWAAVVGVTIQYFLNMEIERYTLATGETAVAGFARFWKPWGVLFCVFTIVPNMWPGWGTAGATILTYLIGGNPNVIAIILLISIGVALTASPVVYQTLEKAEFFKVGLTIVFLAIAVFAAIKASAWADLPDAVTGFGNIPSDEVAIATILAGLVFAGAGGANNLVQSNWIRDKGFGMGAYVPHIVSPVTGEDQAAPVHRHDGAPGRGEHRALQPLVQAGLQGAARLVLGHLRGLDRRSSPCWPTRPSSARTSPRRRTSTSSRARATCSRTSSRPGSGRCSGSSARSRSRSWRSAWSTTSRGSSPT